jgi:guanidinopropionase
LSGLAGVDSKLCDGRAAALLHLDAHTDTFHNLPHFLGAKKSAAHWASYLVNDNKVDPRRSIQVGIRGNPRTLDWTQTSRDLGYAMISKDDYDEKGARRCADEIAKRVGDAPVYITFDLDCLDAATAPGVSNLEAGETGFTINEALTLLRAVRGKNIIGGDVVCLMPTKDSPNKTTALVAAAVMFEIISLIADATRTPAG